MSEKLKVLDLFSGIGGFSLGLERTGGFETVAFCEIEEFPRRVLKKHWPEVPIYEDVRELTGARLAADGIAPNVITGGFPCQDISVAGKQAGITENTRSGLWSEIVRLVGEIRPEYVIVENVANLLSGPSEKRGGWFGRILGDLAECGYDAEWENIPAAAVGAPHRRERVWVLAYPSCKRWEEEGELVTRPAQRVASASATSNNVAYTGYKRVLQRRCDESVSEESPIKTGIRWHGLSGRQQGTVLANASSKRQQRQRQPIKPVSEKTNENWEASVIEPICEPCVWPAEPPVGRVANGVPDRSHRLAGLGNAVVPQIPELIGHAILEARHEPLR